MMEITEIFEVYYSKYNNEIEVAEQYFRESMESDTCLKQKYLDWCDEMGYTDRKGFKSYFLNKNESDNIWDSIYPNREELEEYDFDLS